VISERELISQYRAQFDALYSYVSRRTGGDRSLAEDVVQETWLRALREWRRKGLPRVPAAWLSKVAGNLLASHYRRLKPQVSVDAGDWPADESARAETPEAAAILHSALGRLRPKQARLIEAFHFDGKALAEIAGDLGISERAAEGRVRRAREALKAALGALKPTTAGTGE
jgi:RNA polymerase sigma-70 factor (ECF subfamily)